VQDSQIQNNLLYNNHASGISLYQIDGGGPSSGNVIVNNTVDQASNGRWALNIQDAATNTTVLNNVLYNNHSFRGSIDISSDSLPGLHSDYNVLMNRMTTNGGDTIMTLAQWQAATGQDQHSIIAAPAQLFVNAAGGDYHLSASSPAVDAGTAQLAPARDLQGQPRPSGAAWDIGASERQTATANHAPVLDTALDPRLTSIKEDQANPASTLVSTLIAGAVTDQDAGALRGIAVTAASNYFGTWQYSLHASGSWMAMVAPTASAARLLPEGANIRFLPRQDFHGQVKLYYRAWDQTQGSAGGVINVAGNTGGSRSLSTAAESAAVKVKPVNDKPALSLGGQIAYSRNAAAVVLASAATVQDVDSSIFTGRLRVWITTGDSITNRLAIGGGFTIDALGNVRHGSTVIGRRTSDGFGTNDLIVRFNATVTPAIGQELVRAITFRTFLGVAGQRQVNFTISDGVGGLSDVRSMMVNVV
jgi:hypothetical protein